MDAVGKTGAQDELVGVEPQSGADTKGRRENFAHRLEQYGDAIAIVAEDGATVSFSELARRADAFAESLGEAPRLVLIEAANELPPLVAYIGCLRHGHPVMLAAAGADHVRLVDTFRPEARFAGRKGQWSLTLDRHPQGGLHPDLAVLLSTSGTTGATKLVRLAGAAIDANAASIGQYLEIGPGDRAITSLPFHYSYGLSVVNSHLRAGATIILTDRSVVDPEFWRLFEEQRATSLAGVPYTYELLERVGFQDRALPSLRTLTQAGGRLPPDAVSRMAAWAESRQVRFFVMYGQTEASARMAYLPPERAQSDPTSIGVPIPGGEFRLVGQSGRPIYEADVVGELVYRGPNVMMGYGLSREDLSRASELLELRTGDLASRDASGLYRIAGRKSRFAKIFGLRVSLDEVEAQLRHLGAKGVAAVSDDEHIYIATTGGPEPLWLATSLGEQFKLPSSIFHVSRLEDLPTLPSGKIDYRAILRSGEAAARTDLAPAETSQDPVDAAFKRAFPRATIKPGDSFVSLGGDSLNYVNLSIELERIFGTLPENWESLTVEQLSAFAPRSRPLRWWSQRTIETEVVLRALAIAAVVVTHASDLVVGGGAEALLILAGYNLSRYQKSRLQAGQGAAVAGSFMWRIIAPYYALLLVYFLTGRHAADLPSMLLVSNFFGRFGSLLEPFWFLEVMAQCLALVAVLSLVPPIQRAIARDPWRFGLACLLVAVVVKSGAYAIFQHKHLLQRTPDAVLPFLALGWCVNEASTPHRRWVLTAMFAALAGAKLMGTANVWPSYEYPANISHAIWMGLCAVGLLWVRRVPLPNLLHRGVAAVAAASFYIYLTHMIPLWVFHWALGWNSVSLDVVTAILVGLAAWTFASRGAPSFPSAALSLATLSSRSRAADQPRGRSGRSR